MRQFIVSTLIAATCSGLPSTVLSDTACLGEFLDPINLSSKRVELVSAYPPLPEPITLAGLRAQGSRHVDYEISVLGGWRSEIEGRCIDVKKIEARVVRKNRLGDVTPNELEICLQAIEEERQLCDVKYRDTSPYYALLRDIEAFNRRKFEELKKAWNECIRNNSCNS